MTLCSGAFGAGTLAAQAPAAASTGESPGCTALADPTKAVCQAAHDAASSAIPSWGLVIGGGNPAMGTASANGKFGRTTITLRGNYALIPLPSSRYDGTTDTVPDVRRRQTTLPSLDLAFGILQKTLPMGIVGVDFLGTMFLVDPTGTYDVSFPDDARRLAGRVVGFGWGARIAMAPTGPLPTASLNVTKRTLPDFRYGDLADGSTYTYTLGISAIDVRLMLGRRFGGFEFTAGGGVDLLKGTYSILSTNPVTHALQPQDDSTRTAMRVITAANAAFDLKPLRLTFEGGYQVGKDEKLPTIVKGVNPRSGKFFAGVGLGVRF